MHSNSSLWNGACGSASWPIICIFITLHEIDTGTWVSAATGQGPLGIGGASGPGNAANAGYQGMPVTLTVAVKLSHAVPITCAITLEYFISIGLDLGADARISGVHGGPTIWPPIAVTALITTPTIVAAVCHWLHAEQIAEQVPSMNAPILPMCIFCVSVWYLFSDAGWTSGGIPGADAFSSGLNARL